jgi:putative PIG3 family NAD(P)H quinone oxidoreductase
VGVQAEQGQDEKLMWNAELVQAIVVRAPGGPEVLELAEVPEPGITADEILIEVTAAGVNRADLMQRQGHYPPPPGASDILGLECSGHVAAVGADVAGWRIGDRCVALLAGGGYAERVAVPAGQVVAPPPGLDLVAAGGVIEVAATVWSNLDLAGLRAGQRFLVHGGAGGIGSFAIGYARSLGAAVAATAGSADKLAYCRTLGADLAVSYREEWVRTLRSWSEGRGIDVILDNMGASGLEANVGALAVGGRLMIIGLQGGRTGTLDLGALLAKRASVTATSLRARPVAEKAAICAALVEQVWPKLVSGEIRPSQHRVYSLAEAADAHRLLESGANLGKVVLQVSPVRA